MTIHEPRERAESAAIELNGVAPDFEVMTTHGHINFYDWHQGKWVILFSHPNDFTPVCTSEFIAFARIHDQLHKRGVMLLGTSVDGVHSHIAWVRNIEANFGVKIPFPIVADLDMKVARLYGMLHERSSSTAPVRCVFFIDPRNLVRAMIYYPLNVGRNFDEIVRVVDALQTVDEHGVATPADWRPGDKVIVPPPSTTSEAEKRVKNDDLDVVDWYFAKKSL